MLLRATALGWCVAPDKLYREIAFLGREFAPTLRREEHYAYTSSTLKRARASAIDEADELRYRYRNSRLIDMLKITQDEMRQLSTIIDSDEKRRRHREAIFKARRAAGAVPRDTILARAAERASEAKRMASEGFSQRQIARELSITQAWVSKILAG